MAVAFEWDHQKDLANQQKHGVAFKEESTVFGDPLAWFQHDMDYSHAEERFLLLGRSSSNRLLAVLFTDCPREGRRPAESFVPGVRDP